MAMPNRRLRPQPGAQPVDHRSALEFDGEISWRLGSASKGPSESDPTRHSCTIYDSIQDVPREVWSSVVTEVDFAMDRGLVTLQQRTLREQSRMWGVGWGVARNDTG